MDQVAEIAIGIFKEDEAVALIAERLSLESDTFGLKQGIGGIEIVNGDSEVADAWGLHFVGAGCAIARDNFEHGTILGLDEIIARVFEIDVELKVSYIPIGESLGVRGSNCGVFEALKHRTHQSSKPV